MKLDKHIASLIERELEQWRGVIGYEYEQGKKHQRIYLNTAKGTRFVTFAVTPSDYRAAKNIITNIRKELRSLGAKKE